MRLILEAGIDPDAEGSQAQSSPVTVAVIERRDFSLPQLGLGLAEGRVSVALQAVTFDLSIGTTRPFIVSPALVLGRVRLVRHRSLALPGA